MTVYQEIIDDDARVALEGLWGNRFTELKLVREEQFREANSHSLALRGEPLDRHKWMAEHFKLRS